MNVLTIDTSERHLIKVSIDREDKHFEKEHEQEFGSQVLINLIQDVLKDAELELSDLDEIKVAKGPGSYTGLRVGAAVANALGYSLEIPVNGGKMEVELKYA